MTKPSEITKNFSEEIYMTSKDGALSWLPALVYGTEGRYIYICFDKSIDSAGGIYEVNDSVGVCEEGDPKHFETFSEPSAYIKTCHYPFTDEQLQEFKQMLIDMKLFGPHLA